MPQLDDVKKICQSMRTLPSLPVITEKILSLSEEKLKDAALLNKIISLDPSLTMKVLKLVNSDFFGNTGKISTLTQAYAILTPNTLKSILLSASSSKLSSQKTNPHFHENRFWGHSYAVARAAKEIAKAREEGSELQDVYYTAGMIHDIGKLVLKSHWPKEFSIVCENAFLEKSLLFPHEKKLFGVSHLQIGRWLAKHWQLPVSAVEAIFYHHQPNHARKAPLLASMIHLADYLCNKQNIGHSGNYALPPLSKKAWNLVGIDEETFWGIGKQLPEWTKEAKNFLRNQ